MGSTNTDTMSLDLIIKIKFPVAIYEVLEVCTQTLVT